MSETPCQSAKDVPCPPLPLVSHHLDWSTFREDAHKVVDFIADYHESLSQRAFSPMPVVEPGFLANMLPMSDVPAEPAESITPILSMVQKMMTGCRHWQHPDFLAWFPLQATPGALMGEMIAGALANPGFSWHCCPTSTELEVNVMNWLARALGLPKAMTWSSTGGGVLSSTASEAMTVSMLGAKSRRLLSCTTAEDRADVMSRMVCYISDQAHFCVEKAAAILSIQHVRKVQTRRCADGNCPMTGDDLEALVKNDIADGLLPFFTSANYGTTGVCATDDFVGVSRVCRQYGMWLNVDAAYAGITALCPEMRAPIQPALDSADTLIINGSKGLGTMMSTSFFFFRERCHISRLLSSTGVYLDNKYNSNHDDMIDLKNYHLGMGRPFSAMKVFTALTYTGLSGLQNKIRRHCLLGEYLHNLLKAHGSHVLELPIQPKFALVCFRMKENNDNVRTTALHALFDDEGRYMIAHTSLDNRTILRIVLGDATVTKEEVHSLADYIIQKANQISERAHPS